MTGVLLLWILPGLFVAAAISDLTSFTIPNILPAAMLALFVVFLASMALSGHPLSWHETSLHLLAGLIGLAAGMALFATGWVGGGDAKLLAAACLWLGWNALIEYIVMATLFGGLLTLWLLTLRRMPLTPWFATKQWVVRLVDPKSGVRSPTTGSWSLPDRRVPDLGWRAGPGRLPAHPTLNNPFSLPVSGVGRRSDVGRASSNLW